MKKLYPWQALAHNSQTYAKIALRNVQGEIFTWQELALQINNMASWLQQQGVGEQSLVAFCGKNSEKILLLYLASIQLGAKVLGLNPAFPESKISQYCQIFNVDFCYRETDLPDCNKTFPKNTAFFQPVDFNRPATLTLTSGSTGDAKAVVHNLNAHLANAKGVCALMQFNANCSWLLSLPLFHVSGQGIVWRWLLKGAQLHLPGQDFYFSLLNCTHASLVPTQLQRLLDYLPNYLGSCLLQHILLGGTQIPVPLTQALQAYQIESYSGYGMTEMASTIFAKKSDGKKGVGQPLAGREYCLQNGEIWLRGAGLAMGYWLNQQIQPMVNSQGWLATKDKGIWQDDELVIVGRLDNQFISGGENIQPEEIERLISDYPDIKQVIILPVVDKEFGQRPVAVISFKTELTEKEWQDALTKLKVFLQPKLESFKQPIAYFAMPSSMQQGIKIARRELALWLDSVRNVD